MTNNRTDNRTDNRKHRLTVIMICIMTAFAFAAAAGGCSSGNPAQEYLTDTVLISGLEGGDVNLTVGDMSKLEMTDAAAQGDTAKAGTVKAKGPALSTLFDSLGVSLDDVKSIKFIAADGYEITLTANTWDKYEVIVSLSNGDEPLNEDERPVRIVAPGAESGKWIRGVCEMRVKLKQ